MKLLIAEDTVDLNRALQAILKTQNYEVDAVYDGEEAMTFIEQQSYDGIILDIMMPKKDGIEVLKEIRAKGLNTPVLLLTAKTEVDDRVAGLDAGADDYLPKPFAMKELLARIRSMTRRQTEYNEHDIAYADFTLQAASFELTAENSVSLSGKEYELLRILVANAGRELTTEFLLEHIWGDEEGASSDTVWLYISYIKGKLASVASSVQIDGTRGGSYKLQ